MTPQMANSWTFIFEQSAIIIITQGSEYHGVDFDFFSSIGGHMLWDLEKINQGPE